MIRLLDKFAGRSSVGVNIISPMIVLSIISVVLVALIIILESRSHQLLIEQKKDEYINHMQVQHIEFKKELRSVAGLIANHPIIKNGLLLGNQYEVLNSLSLFLGHSDIDLLNIYDLDGIAFARAQSPSYFGDTDEISELATNLISQSAATGADQLTDIGIVRYRDAYYLVAADTVDSVSGMAGVIVVGSRVDDNYLSNLLPEWFKGIVLHNSEGVLLSSIDVSELNDLERIFVVSEPAVYSNDIFNIDLIIEDISFASYWRLPIWIAIIAIVAGLFSIIFTFIFLYRRVIYPVKHLIDVAEEQVSGNLSARVSLDYNDDELGRLGQILNKLTLQLKTTLEELEERVKSRTQELTQAKELAEIANRSKSRFLAAASHDLRQPVNAIGLLVSNITANTDSKSLNMELENVSICVNSLREMFDKILNISRLESGLVEPKIEDFPVDRVLRQVTNEYAPLAMDNKISLKYISSSITIRSDPVLIHRILSNLVCNSIRYTKRGRVVLGCKMYMGSAKIIILDSGVGIAEEDVDMVFEEYFRGDNQSIVNQNVGVGMGLGLSIAEHTAKLLGHRLEVKSKVDKYTIFSIHVPLINHEADLSVDCSDSVINFSSLAGLKVLLVDDNAMSLRAVQITLESWGCEVDVSDSYRGAHNLVRYRNNVPDLLIFDYLLDENTGLDLLTNIQEYFDREIPCIIISGVISKLIEKNAREAGCYLLYKPIIANQLRDLIDDCLVQDTDALTT